MFVVTHKDELGDPKFTDPPIDAKMLKSKVTSPNIPEENIWLFENYTSKSNLEDLEKDIELLRFLDKTVFMCAQNIRTVETEKKEKREGKSWFSSWLSR